MNRDIVRKILVYVTWYFVLRGIMILEYEYLREGSSSML